MLIPDIKSKQCISLATRKSFVSDGARRGNVELCKSKCQEECVKHPCVLYLFTVFIALT